MTELFAFRRKRGIRSHRRRGRWVGLCRPGGVSRIPPFQGGQNSAHKRRAPSLPSGDPTEAQPSGGFGGERRRCAVTELFAFRRKRGIRSHRRRGRWVGLCRPGGVARITPCQGGQNGASGLPCKGRWQNLRFCRRGSNRRRRRHHNDSFFFILYYFLPSAPLPAGTCCAFPHAGRIP